MRVFGDGSIWVCQPKITLTANHGLSPTFYLDGEPHSTGDIYVWPTKFYTITVSDVPGYEFDYFSYDGGTWGPQPSLQLLHSGEFKAHYNPTQQYCLTIQSSYGGYTDPPAGDYYYPEGTPAEVTAHVDDPQYWEWDHWNRDGQEYSSNPTVTFPMYSDHTLKPIFNYNPPQEYHYLTLEYWGWVGGWVYMAGGTNYLPEDTYTLTVPWTVYGLNFMCWYYDGAYRNYDQNSITIFLGEDRYFAALYIMP